MITADLVAKAEQLVTACRWKGVVLATAESCTGGLVAAALTEVAGSSAVFDRGFVTYSNAAKQEQLGVPGALLDEHGAVSAACARSMASGALAHSRATVAVSITGIAGPGGGSPEKPVGLVHFGCARRGALIHIERHFGPLGRTDIRSAAVAQALQMLTDAVAACM